ncbi:hypothetical protein H8356DRAFT_1324302 [Neocallimastix lanati (nom. inval.)]|nr:hypothetical protein H8356DRAFT_1324302 [Neocallimastix sp. JGI-2020a]
MEPFYRIVMDGEAGTVMASYNTINGTYSTQNKRLLTDRFVMSEGSLLLGLFTCINYNLIIN